MNDDQQARRDLRRDPRRLLMLRVDVREGGDDRALASAWTADVSAGGVSLRGAKSLARGQIVRMSLSFPGLLEPMDVLGDVVWAQSTLSVAGGVGVRVWSSLDRERLAHLAQLAGRPQTRRVRPYRVVIMETDPLAALTYRIALDELHPVSSAHLELTLTRGWDETREQLEAAPADMIILGLHPKYRDSKEALSFVRGNAAIGNKSIVVALAGGDDPDLLRHASLVADATFVKPVPLARIVDTIGHLLNRRAEKHANVAYI
ncbi:MAG: PilZ domain-containing protein [Myxococcota bacterium]|nr:PilZ domain-containing protein [Myxococcota bacterium]